jgi:alkanesulfonate monooxygenase SsuD/methylene tetrahydromethanopterin reductase-like flavin-dependent oxidoreductase (luciferase family)
MIPLFARPRNGDASVGETNAPAAPRRQPGCRRRRRATLEVAREIERRGFAGIYAPSVFSNMSLCEAGACYGAHCIRHLDRADLCAHGWRFRPALLHEVSGGRFRLGIGRASAGARAWA